MGKRRQAVDDGRDDLEIHDAPRLGGMSPGIGSDMPPNSP
jgi:hypothetical protein